MCHETPLANHILHTYHDVGWIQKGESIDFLGMNEEGQLTDFHILASQLTRSRSPLSERKSARDPKSKKKLMWGTVDIY